VTRHTPPPALDGANATPRDVAARSGRLRAASEGTATQDASNLIDFADANQVEVRTAAARTTRSSQRDSSKQSKAEAKGSVGVHQAQSVAADAESSRATGTELTGRLGQELQLIQRARRQLRAHDLQGALTTLRLHIELYPDGELTPEANRLRLQAQREMAADD
jgi:TolA-binding protein